MWLYPILLIMIETLKSIFNFHSTLWIFSPNLNPHKMVTRKTIYFRKMKKKQFSYNKMKITIADFDPNINTWFVSLFVMLQRLLLLLCKSKKKNKKYIIKTTWTLLFKITNYERKLRQRNMILKWNYTLEVFKNIQRYLCSSKRGGTEFISFKTTLKGSFIYNKEIYLQNKVLLGFFKLKKNLILIRWFNLT